MPQLNSDEPFSDEEQNIYREIEDVFDDPEGWLTTPNNLLGGREPRDLIDSHEVQQLRNLIRMIKHGVTS